MAGVALYAESAALSNIVLLGHLRERRGRRQFLITFASAAGGENFQTNSAGTGKGTGTGTGMGTPKTSKNGIRWEPDAGHAGTRARGTRATGTPRAHDGIRCPRYA